MNIAAQKRSFQVSRVPLLIATDQEGGDVVRLRTRVPLPSALAFGELNDPSLMERAGKATGQLLKTLGFNMNLAPVVDIADPTRKSFIGTRTYGSQVEQVTRLGLRFAMGLKSSGVLPTTKHFPGHGDLAEDTHVTASERSVSYQQLRSRDLVPYYVQSKELKGASAVMVAHISYPSLDPSGVPATFSKKIISEHLRQKIGFDGVVVTDDIEMAGAAAPGPSESGTGATLSKTQGGGATSAIKSGAPALAKNNTADLSERAIKAIEAGVDMVMVAWNRKQQARIADAISSAINKGRLSESRINESVRRILRTKREYAQGSTTPPSAEALRFALRNPEFLDIGNAVATYCMDRSAKAAQTFLSTDSGNRPLYVFSANEQFYKSFKEALGERPSRLIRLGQGKGALIEKAMRAKPEALGVYYLSGPRVAQLLDGVSEDVARRMLIVNTETLGLLKNPSLFGHVVDIHYRHPGLGRLTAEYFFKTTPRQPAVSSQPASRGAFQGLKSYPGVKPASTSSTSPITGAL
jgi:beta-N-acetylhexosaminidase